jgi:glycosyltransferase involved in cell wall biosynthesis
MYGNTRGRASLIGAAYCTSEEGRGIPATANLTDGAPEVAVLQNSTASHHPRHHYRLAAALQAAGYEVTLLARPQPGASRGVVPVRYLPRTRGRLARMVSAPLALWAALRRRPSLVYVVTLELLPWAVLARRFSRTPIVYDSNEEYDTLMLLKDWLPRNVRPLLQRAVRWGEPALARRLDAATTALPDTQTRFARAGVRTVHVRNFPPVSVVAAQPRGDEFEYDIMLGGSLPPDQIPILAATAAELERLGTTGVRWLLVARNHGAAERQMLDEALRTYAVRHLFTLLEDIPFDEMAAMMARSRLGFVLYPDHPNYAARIPLRIFELMAAGVPFVASDLRVTSELLDGLGVAELVEAGNPAAYARAFRDLLADPARQAEMSRRGPALVRERFTWEKESEKLIDLVAAVLGQPAPAGNASLPRS